jgi:hypothetical protein
LVYHRRRAATAGEAIHLGILGTVELSLRVTMGVAVSGSNMEPEDRRGSVSRG